MEQRAVVDVGCAVLVCKVPFSQRSPRQARSFEWVGVVVDVGCAVLVRKVRVWQRGPRQARSFGWVGVVGLVWLVFAVP